MIKEYYELLEVSVEATDQELKKSYRRLARKYHPDVNPSEEAKIKFQKISVAYELLSDPDKRAMIDQGVDPLKAGNSSNNGGYSANFSDLFEAFFGQSQNSRRGKSRVRAGEDGFVEVSLTLEESAEGVKRDIEVETAIVCDECSGKGTKDKEIQLVTCDQCSGTGEIQHLQRSILGQVVTTSICSKCSGFGELIKDPCFKCNGDGRVRARKTISIDIPAGVGEGMQVKLSGYGEVGLRGAPAGDLYVEIHESPHKIFLREDDNLFLRIDESITDAILGTNLSVRNIFGEDINIELKAGVQPGEIIEIKGEGMPNPHSGRRGDLFAQVNIRIPNNLSDDELGLIQDLKKNSENFNSTVITNEKESKSENFFQRLRKKF